MAKFCKIEKYRKYVSYDNGQTWEPLNEYSEGSVIEKYSEWCGATRIYRWVKTDERECEEYEDKVEYHLPNGEVYSIGCNDEGDQFKNKYADDEMKTRYQKMQTTATVVTVHKCAVEVPNLYRGYNLRWIFLYLNDDEGLSFDYDVDGLLDSFDEYDESHLSCLALEKLTIEDGIEAIGEAACANAYSLNEVSIPKSVERIKILAFYRTFSLNEINLNEGLEYIDGGAFLDSGLVSLTLPSTVKELGYVEKDGDHCNASAFGGSPLWCLGAFQASRRLENVKLNDGLTRIGMMAFANCISLKSIDIPSSVETLGYRGNFYQVPSSPVVGGCNYTVGAFLGCTSLTDVKLNEGLKYIGGYCFYRCASLKEITIPSTVEEIYDESFSKCDSLESITFKGSTPPSFVGDYPLGYRRLILYVPKGSASAYAEALKKGVVTHIITEVN